MFYEQNLSTGQVQRIRNFMLPPYSVEDADICAATWTSDGQQLVIALCHPGSVDYFGYPPEIFVYTPPNS
jgi:hypothetical protein